MCVRVAGEGRGGSKTSMDPSSTALPAGHAHCNMAQASGRTAASLLVGQDFWQHLVGARAALMVRGVVGWRGKFVA